jgi:hypothetical protein
MIFDKTKETNNNNKNNSQLQIPMGVGRRILLEFNSEL